MTFKLGILDFYTDDGCHTLADILTGEIRLGFFEQLIGAGVIVERLRKGCTETFHMHTAFRRNDVVDESVGIFLESVVVLHGHFHIDIVPDTLAVNDLIVEGG